LHIGDADGLCPLDYVFAQRSIDPPGRGA